METPTPQPTSTPVPISDVPPQPVEVDVDRRITTTRAVISWEAPPQSSAIDGKPVEGYHLIITKSSSGEVLVDIKLDSSVTSYTMNDLTPETSYNYSVSSFNALGHSEAVFGWFSTQVLVPTSTPTPATTPTPVSRKSLSKGRTVYPDPPDDVSATQRDESIIIRWDDPYWDGGDDILGYALTWRPDPPTFPIFVPPDDEAIELYGLKSDVQYRVLVSSVNRVDESLPSRNKLMIENTLASSHPGGPYAGSIIHGHSTVLKNDDALAGFEMIADSQTLFWGDHMLVEVANKNLDVDLQSSGKALSAYSVVSDVFGISATIGSARKKQQSTSELYRFDVPMSICINPIQSQPVAAHALSIAVLTDDTEIELLDSTPILDGASVKVCASIAELPLNGELVATLVTRADAGPIQPDGTVSFEPMMVNAE